jgi:alpha-L-arabinofuranosidase
MKTLQGLTIFLLICMHTAVAANDHNEPDSVYLFSYATTKSNNHNGLHFAWSRDRQSWQSIGHEYGYLKCDYGRWGSEKRMISPFLVQGPDGTWQCVWSINEKEKLFAHAASADLVNWGRQSYPLMQQGANCLRPVLRYDSKQGNYIITYTDATGRYYHTTTRDFKTYSTGTEAPASEYVNTNITIQLPEGPVSGQLHRVPWSVVEQLIKTWELKQYKNNQNSETTLQDAQRFANLKPLQATITVQPEKAKPISNMLLGVFFEDINYAADGGLYAELVQNRDFEYALNDKEGRDQNWNSTYAWSVRGAPSTFTIDSAMPVHANNPHYAVLNTTSPGAALVNGGFDRIVVKKGERYNFSVFTRGTGKLLVQLVSAKEGVLAKAVVNASSSNWKKVSAVLTATLDAEAAELELRPLVAGKLCLDMVSLFPEKTFKGRKNGLRTDLAQTIADIHPRFVRFPGGCVAHGDGLQNIYRWKNTIGPLEARVPQRNLWGYHQTAGLGYFEYFQFCEDIGAEPVPVLAAGVPCQNSASSPSGGGQQGGIPMEEMDAYVQDIIDLVEYANGDINTKWGQQRAKAGHPKPFNLKYIGIGNEDLISDVFEERFNIIYKALQQKHPEITVIGTVGPFNEGTDYMEGWKLATKEQVPVVDEHYYQTPGWFINNQDYYDRYDRSKSKVYLGEYAAHLPGRPNNLETALAEALYLTAVERNGDVVKMASYAPLLAKEGRTQWNPDLIYFNNSEVKPTTGYYVQKLYGQHAGDVYLPSTIALDNNQDAVKKRVAVSIVRDTKTNDLVIKMVNCLPVAVHTTIAGITGGQAMKTVLQGKPADNDLQPVETALTLAQATDIELAAYSFTVLRIHAN